MPRPRRLLAGMAVVSLLAVVSALLTQHVGGLLPCAWCVMQRLIFCSIAAAALIGLLVPGVIGRRLGASLGLLLAGCGIAAALWQHVVAAASASCNLSFADRVMDFTGLDRTLPEVFAAYASCADAKVNLVGVPYEFWSLTLFSLLALTACRVLARPA